MRRACIRPHIAVAGEERRHLSPKSRSMTHGHFLAKRRRHHRPLCSIERRSSENRRSSLRKANAST